MKKIVLTISCFWFMSAAIANADWPKGTYVCNVVESTDYRTNKFNGPLVVYFNLIATKKNFRPWFLHIYKKPNATGFFPGVELLSLGIDPRYNGEQQRKDCLFDEIGFDEASPMATNKFYSSEKCPGGFSQSFAVDSLVDGAEYGKGTFSTWDVGGTKSHIIFNGCLLKRDLP